MQIVCSELTTINIVDDAHMAAEDLKLDVRNAKSGCPKHPMEPLGEGDSWMSKAVSAVSQCSQCS